MADGVAKSFADNNSTNNNTCKFTGNHNATRNAVGRKDNQSSRMQGGVTWGTWRGWMERQRGREGWGGGDEGVEAGSGGMHCDGEAQEMHI